MKKLLMSALAPVLALLLCSCAGSETRTTRFLLDTTVTVTLYGNDGKLSNNVFDLCKQYEGLLSKTDKNSEVYRINHSQGSQNVSGDTADLISRALEYYKVSGGRFDVTVCPVSDLWDFNKNSLPDKNDISAALKRVGANKIELNGNTVNTNGAEMDLGGIAKGWIADKLTKYLKEKGVKKAILNLGGNVAVIGGDYTVGIRRPFDEDGIITRVKVSNTSVVTSGVYERYIKADGKIYHHILDPKTGYGVDTDLLSATIICENSCKADALSTVCILFGQQKSTDLIEKIEGAEAIFVDKNYKITATSGLKLKNGVYIIK